MKKTCDSKAMREVWKWKDEAYKEVAHLSLDAALKKRLDDCVRIERTRRDAKAK